MTGPAPHDRPRARPPKRGRADFAGKGRLCGAHGLVSARLDHHNLERLRVRNPELRIHRGELLPEQGGRRRYVEVPVSDDLPDRSRRIREINSKAADRSEEHTSELESPYNMRCSL